MAAFIDFNSGTTTTYTEGTSLGTFMFTSNDAWETQEDFELEEPEDIPKPPVHYWPKIDYVNRSWWDLIPYYQMKRYSKNRKFKCKAM